MKKTDITIRNADIDDAELLYSWANDISVRINAFSQEDFTFEDHLIWFNKKLSDENCHIYIATLPADEGESLDEFYTEGDSLGRAALAESLGTPGADSISTYRALRERPVGQIRLDISDGVADIDYSVDRRYRGRGIGRQLLYLATLYRDEVRTFRGLVKPSNKASAKAFEAAGFRLSGEGSKGDTPYLIYTLEREDVFKRDERGKDGSAADARKRILICTIKSWNIRNAQIFANRYAGVYDIFVITSREGLTPEAVKALEPDYILFPHWSYYIPKDIFTNYECIVFHMCDLPYGRGGSPLQNLIVRGHKSTMISALRVEEDLDAGPVYLKEPLSLAGTADDILKRASQIIFDRMIPAIIWGNITPKAQEGQPVLFERRKPEDGRLRPDMDLPTVYDYIRMLDGEGYPPAFMDFNDTYVMEFDAALPYEGGDELTARVRFRKR